MIPASLFAGLFIHFALISMMAIGGFMATLPGMYSYLVDTAALLTPEQFAKTVAFGQSLPRPQYADRGRTRMGWRAGLSARLHAQRNSNSFFFDRSRGRTIRART